VTCSPLRSAGNFPIDYPEPQFEVADIVRMYGDAYRGPARHRDLPHQRARRARRQMRPLRPYRGQLQLLPQPPLPKCRASQRSAWVDARTLEMLPIQYFHIVFTLPEDLNRLAQYHPSAVYGNLMRAAGETLQTFARNRWGGDLGIVTVLHTRGQTLQLHPHVHCMVTGGALKRDGSAFVQAPQNFLFPHRALARVFRAVFLRALERLRADNRFIAGPPKHDAPPVQPVRQSREAWKSAGPAIFSSGRTCEVLISTRLKAFCEMHRNGTLMLPPAGELPSVSMATLSSPFPMIRIKMQSFR
jgi:hypothetical protein